LKQKDLQTMYLQAKFFLLGERKDPRCQPSRHDATYHDPHRWRCI